MKGRTIRAYVVRPATDAATGESYVEGVVIGFGSAAMEIAVTGMRRAGQPVSPLPVTYLVPYDIEQDWPGRIAPV